jgi:lipopolysaccharide/colanic/teichoic acid biosynthesis glycosyltransferase
MQTNPTIPQDTSAHSAVTSLTEEIPIPATSDGMIEDIAATTDFHVALFGVERVSSIREFATQDYALPDISERPYLKLVRKQTPYVSIPTYKKVIYDMSKRGIDIVGSLTLLLIALPLILIVAVLIKVKSPGPVLFRHKRLGRQGKEFWLVKFRTMAVNAEDQLKTDFYLSQQFAANYKIKGDPRITNYGEFMRKTSIDELPQLWNVLKGDMSLIGPRPIVKPELSKYAIYGKKLLTVKPGLSGLWQACGRSDTTYAERVLMDMQYIDHRCLFLDLRLLLFTAIAVLRRSGAC